MSPSPGSASIESEIAAGWDLFGAGRREKAIEHFWRLAERNPGDLRTHFEFGGSLDAAGHEAEAIPQYRRAIGMGLSGAAAPRALLQLGSSLRNVGEHEEAVRVLSEGRGRGSSRITPRCVSSWRWRSMMPAAVGKPSWRRSNSHSPGPNRKSRDGRCEGISMR